MSDRPRSPAPRRERGRAEAQRSRPERPALSKSAVGPARACGPPGSGAPLEPRLTGCCAGVRSTAGVGSRARSSPLPSGLPSVRPFVRQHGPAPAKASAPSPPTCPKSCCTSASWSASSMCVTMPCSCCLCFRRAARPHRGADKMARWFWLARQEGADRTLANNEPNRFRSGMPQPRDPARTSSAPRQTKKTADPARRPRPPQGPVAAREWDVAHAAALRALLTELPAVLPNQVGDPLLPLQIGIRDALLALLRPGAEPEALARALRAYTRSTV